MPKQTTLEAIALYNLKALKSDAKANAKAKREGRRERARYLKAAGLKVIAPTVLKRPASTVEARLVSRAMGSTK